MKIAVINGPNINMLGKRIAQYYGKKNWDSIEASLYSISIKEDINLLFFQSNHEGDIVDYIQSHYKLIDGVVINPAAFTYSGYSIIDALEAVSIPFVEVHISNIYKRGDWHAKSVFSEYAVGTISGFKDYSYVLGIYSIIHYLKENKNEEIEN